VTSKRGLGEHTVYAGENLQAILDRVNPYKTVNSKSKTLKNRNFSRDNIKILNLLADLRCFSNISL
jgi:hypothetical protein